jgi:hypothetical protein
MIQVICGKCLCVDKDDYGSLTVVYYRSFYYVKQRGFLVAELEQENLGYFFNRVKAMQQLYAQMNHTIPFNYVCTDYFQTETALWPFNFPTVSLYTLLTLHYFF